MVEGYPSQSNRVNKGENGGLSVSDLEAAAERDPGGHGLAVLVAIQIEHVEQKMRK